MTARRRPGVLVIDDEPTIRELLCDFLAVLGYDAAGAADGAEGLALFKRGGYGLVVTDLFMPGMSGWDVVAAVRQQVPAMPMVLISGFAAEPDVQRARPQGLPFLRKPFRLDDLTWVVAATRSATGSEPRRRGFVQPVPTLGGFGPAWIAPGHPSGALSGSATSPGVGHL